MVVGIMIMTILTEAMIILHMILIEIKNLLTVNKFSILCQQQLSHPNTYKRSAYDFLNSE